MMNQNQLKNNEWAGCPASAWKAALKIGLLPFEFRREGLGLC